MPFLLYRRQPDTVSVRYERLQPLRVGGPDGVIARFVKTLPGRAADAGWEVAASELIRLAGLGADPADQAILFEVPADEPGAVCFYQLHRVCGHSRDHRTQLSMDLEVLVDGPIREPVEEFRRAFTLPGDRPGRRLAEILQLGGGPAGGDWKWETPAMKLGATVVTPTSLVPATPPSAGRQPLAPS